MPNVFIRLLKEHPADFSFGLIGVPMGFAAANVANYLGNVGFSLTFGLLTVLFLQFTVAILVSVYALDKALTLWKTARSRLLLTMLCVVLFALALIVISSLPPTCPEWCIELIPLATCPEWCIELVPLALFACMVFLWIPACLSYVKDLQEHIMPLLLILLLTVVIMTTVIIIEVARSTGLSTVPALN